MIELQLTVGETPFVEAWRKGLAQIVSELDKDGDGMLSREETDQPIVSEEPSEHRPAVAEKPRSKAKKPDKPSLLQTANLWDADAGPRDGKLSIGELAWFLSRQGRGAFQTESAPETAAIYSPQLTVVNNAGQRLWDWLDQDDDSQLSPEELRGASVSLKTYDLDADETISLNELQGVDNPFFSAQQSNQNVETPFFAVLREQSTTPVIRRLLQRYGTTRELSPPKSQSTETAEQEQKPTGPLGVKLDVLKIPPAQSARFDRDGNGLLDQFELRAYLNAPVPMVRIGVELPADGKTEPKLTGAATEEKSNVVVKKSTAGSVSILAGEIQIEFDAGGIRPETLMLSLEERFKQCDIDNNGYLERQESRRDQFFNNQFKAYDADGDEKLYPEEWKPPVENAIKQAATQTRMAVENAGKDVFTVLDADRNLKISPREWLSAADRLAIWDKNNNGKLELDEVPHVYRISLGPGLPELPNLLNRNNNSQTPKVQQLLKGPKWFQAMDKNTDGDVSLKEFLGKPDQFRRIDLDQDNLIDPQEATRFSN